MPYVWISVGVIAIIIIFYFIITYNEFITLKNKISEAFSTMDVYMAKRFALIPNLVATVKAYSAHEAQTLEKIVELRNKAFNGSTNDKIASDNQITEALSRIVALSENYPDLKANVNYLSLQDELKNSEAEVANARKYFNGVVRKYNTMLETIPSNIIGKMMNLEKMNMFVVASEIERENVKVNF